MTIRCAVGLLGVLGLIGLLPAQDPKPKGKPLPANVVPATFRAQLVVDNRFKAPIKQSDGSEAPDPRNRTGKMHCLVCEHGLSPVVAIFVRADLKPKDPTKPEATAPELARLVKGVDGLIPKYRGDKLAAFLMYLRLDGGQKLVTVKGADGADEKVEAFKEYPDDEKRDVYANELKAFAAAANADNVPLGLAPTTSPSVAAFGIKDTTPVTVIIYNRLRIAQRWELKAEELTNEKVTEILNATEQMITGAKR
jgi:hypothetical protein